MVGGMLGEGTVRSFDLRRPRTELCIDEPKVLGDFGVVAPID
jgi:hypothetical protein